MPQPNRCRHWENIATRPDRCPGAGRQGSTCDEGGGGSKGIPLRQSLTVSECEKRWTRTRSRAPLVRTNGVWEYRFTPVVRNENSVTPPFLKEILMSRQKTNLGPINVDYVYHQFGNKVFSLNTVPPSKLKNLTRLPCHIMG